MATNSVSHQADMPSQDWHVPDPNEPAVLRLLGAIVDASTIAMGASIIVLVFVNVVLHAVEHDLAWTTELSEVLMVWVTFIGGAAAARRGEHIAISELVDQLGFAGRRAALIVAQLISITVLLLLIYFGIEIVKLGFYNRLSVSGLPMAVEYLALPVGSAATLAFVSFDLLNIIRGRGRDLRVRS